MKKLIIVTITALISVILCITAFVSATQSGSIAHTIMLIASVCVFIADALLIAECIAFSIGIANLKKRNPKRRRKTYLGEIISVGFAATAITLSLAIICLTMSPAAKPPVLPSDSDTVSTQNSSDTPSSKPTPKPPIVINDGTLGTVGSVDESNPKNWSVKWDIISNKKIVDSYSREDKISFGNPNKNSYFTLPGIATFRGDNYRTGAVYGTANIQNKTLTEAWKRDTSSISRTDGGAWTGSGWTGQPLIVQWDEDTKKIMNIYDEKKAKPNLTEVIYATMDGHIYFYDIDDGSYTRKPLNMGMAFKGAGALDPRGYPIMYVGSGDKTVGGKYPRMFIINLIDCSIMYERGHSESYNLRPWRAFDSSPLVHAETDTLIWPGENGLLYTIKLNTKYDKSAGTLSIDPNEPVMTRYKTSLGGTLGMESSAVIVENYIYIADNSGMLFCVDVNTMKLKWAQNVHDDTNATPVFRWENGKGYLYTACSTERTGSKSYIYKLDAATGAVIWEKMYDGIIYDKMVSGGVLSSPVLGKQGSDLEGMIIYPIAKTPSAYGGLLVALNTENGEVIWEEKTKHYTWSSPVAVYDENDKGYIIMCDSGGDVDFLDGATGKTISTINIGSNVEASPAVFNDMMVVGTRGQKVYGIKLG